MRMGSARFRQRDLIELSRTHHGHHSADLQPQAHGGSSSSSSSSSGSSSSGSSSSGSGPSGGQQQRVAVARALVTAPALLLGDEPTGNLDTKSTGDVLGVLDRLNLSGRTIVLITHEDDVAAHAKRVIRLVDGQIIEDRRQAPRSAFLEGAR